MDSLLAKFAAANPKEKVTHWITRKFTLMVFLLLVGFVRIQVEQEMASAGTCRNIISKSIWKKNQRTNLAYEHEFEA